MTYQPVDLAAIRERVEKASPGPWESHMLGGGKGGPNWYSVRIAGTHLVDGVDVGNGEGLYAIARCNPSCGKAGPNSKLIARAPEDLKALLSEVEELRKTVIAMAKTLEKVARRNALKGYTYDRDEVSNIAINTLSLPAVQALKESR